MDYINNGHFFEYPKYTTIIQRLEISILSEVIWLSKESLGEGLSFAKNKQQDNSKFTKSQRTVITSKSCFTVRDKGRTSVIIISF